jgi:hypothetical protein
MNDQHDLWLRKYLWDVSAAVALLLGFTPVEEGNGSVTVTYPPHRPNDPHSRDWQTEALVIRDLAYQAIDAGVLPCVGDSHYVELEGKRVRPYEFYRWALAEGYPIPVAWHTRIRQPEPPPPETAQSSPEPSQPSSAGKKPIEQERREAIANILRVLREIDPNFDPDHPHGQKGQFQAMCRFVYPAPGLFDVEGQTFDDAKRGLITFRGGAQLSDYYRVHQAAVKAKLAAEKKNSSNR